MSTTAEDWRSWDDPYNDLIRELAPEMLEPEVAKPQRFARRSFGASFDAEAVLQAFKEAGFTEVRRHRGRGGDVDIVQLSDCPIYPNETHGAAAALYLWDDGGVGFVCQGGRCNAEGGKPTIYTALRAIGVSWLDTRAAAVVGSDSAVNLSEMMVSVSSVTMRPQEWLEKYWLPRGELTVLAGWGDQGKSQVAIDKAAKLSRGELVGGSVRAWENVPASQVLYLSAEDNPETTIAGRWRAAKGADDGMLIFKRSPGNSVMLPDRVEELRQLIQKTGAQLVILDPILAFVPMIYDSHKDQDTRNVLAPLTELAQSEKVALLFIMHLNKGSESSKMISRLSGSTAWSNAARAAWGVGDGEEGEHILFQMKHNLGPETTPQRYALIPDVFEGGNGWIETSHVKMLGDADIDVQDLFDGTADRSLNADLQEAFHEILKDGPMHQTEVVKIITGEMGIDASRATCYRAKTRARIDSRKDGDRWKWAYPGHGHRLIYECPRCKKSGGTSTETGTRPE